ncbi:MAG: amino acid ABC transporter substrate-binding protein [Actinomycetota bacterium]|nr:MAG: amino acid ABC transporter substrate-binding protein [Actinomycetota bacterium]
MRNRKALALFAVLALVAAACGGSGSGGSDDVEEVVETTEAPATTAAPTTTAAPAGDPLVLASLMPLSGDLASLGPGIALGAALAVQQINAAGGINGQDVVLIEGDSGCDGAVALTSLNDVIAQGAQGVMGAACSGTSLAILDTAIAAEVVMVSPSNTSPQFTKMDKKGFYARTAPSDLLQGEVLASLLVEDGVGSVSIISRADSYGRGLAEATAAAFEDAGGTVKTIVYHATDASDFSAEVTALGKGAADAIVGILFPETGCGVLQPAFEQGLLDSPWYMTDGVKDAGLASLCGLGTALDGFKGTAPGSAAGEAKDAFEAAYAGVSADGSPTFIFAPQAYDAVMLMAISAAANGVTGPEIASGLVAASSGGEKCIGVACIALAADGVDVDYVGASGEIELNAVGDPTAATYDIWTTEGDTNPVLKSVDFGS